MSLLLYTGCASPGSATGDSFLAVLADLAQHFPNTLLLPVSPAPPAGGVASPNVDWLTLPPTARRAVRVRLLLGYAAWFRPRASLFFGENVEPYLAASGSAFGQRLVVTETGESAHHAGIVRLSPQPADIRAALLPLLALSFVLDRENDVAALQAALGSAPSSRELHLYASGPLRERQLALIQDLGNRFQGPIVMHLRLLQGLAQNRHALSHLRLLRSLAPQLRINVISERAWGARVADLLTSVTQV
jgi:hypothetical protein